MHEYRKRRRRIIDIDEKETKIIQDSIALEALPNIIGIWKSLIPDMGFDIGTEY
jgi:hypothetical protein